MSSGIQAPGFLPSAPLPRTRLEQWLIRWLDGGWTGKTWARLTPHPWVRRPVLHHVLYPRLFISLTQNPLLPLEMPGGRSTLSCLVSSASTARSPVSLAGGAGEALGKDRPGNSWHPQDSGIEHAVRPGVLPVLPHTQLCPQFPVYFHLK